MQESFYLLERLSLLIDNANSENVTIPEEICDLYKEDIDFQKLRLHLQMRLSLHSWMAYTFTRLPECRHFVTYLTNNQV